VTNQEIATLFKRIGDMLDILGENRFKVLAYRRASDNILSLGQDIRSYWQAGTLQEIPGIGPAIADKIDELLTTGRLEFYDRLEDQVPAGVVSLLEIPDVGPKTAKLLWDELGLQSMAEVEAAAIAFLSAQPGLWRPVFWKSFRTRVRRYLMLRSQAACAGCVLPLATSIYWPPRHSQLRL
jgi:DNA polymerase/3'-5' exonuclease PolX